MSLLARMFNFVMFLLYFYSIVSIGSIYRRIHFQIWNVNVNLLGREHVHDNVFYHWTFVVNVHQCLYVLSCE